MLSVTDGWCVEMTLISLWSTHGRSRHLGSLRHYIILPGCFYISWPSFLDLYGEKGVCGWEVDFFSRVIRRYSQHIPLHIAHRHSCSHQCFDKSTRNRYSSSLLLLSSIRTAVVVGKSDSYSTARAAALNKTQTCFCW